MRSDRSRRNRQEIISDSVRCSSCFHICYIFYRQEIISDSAVTNGQTSKVVGELKGVIADCTTYSIIISGLCESSLIDKAKMFWDDVFWPSKVHDNFVYSSMLKGLCLTGKFIEAWDFLYELADCGATLNNVNYNIVIDAAYKLGLKKKLIKYWER